MKKYLFIVLLVGVWSCEEDVEEPKGYKELKWFSETSTVYDTWTNTYIEITKYHKDKSVNMSVDTTDYHFIEDECEWVHYYIDSIPSYVEFNIVNGNTKRWRVDSLDNFMYSDF